MPHTTSTWALASVDRHGRYIGLLIVHGPVPRSHQDSRLIRQVQNRASMSVRVR
jgi:hypothetical protein